MGEVVDTRRLNSIGVNPYGEPGCSADRVTVLRSGIPGAERTRVSRSTVRPSYWGRDMVFATVNTGVWFGTSDDYRLEHVDWTGRVTRIARWAGPGLAVTGEQVQRYREYLSAHDYYAGYGDRFEREVWPERRAYLPERFPAYESLLALPDGSVWVRTYRWRGPGEELHLLDRDGVWLRRLTMPAGSVILDAGPDWVLVRRRNEFDVPTVALYELVEGPH